MTLRDLTPSDGRLSGILVPHELTVWAAETTLDEAGAEPGRLVADRATGLRVLASGEPVAAEAWELLASVGGVPGGGLNDDGGGARFLQRPTTDPAADWRGLDPPTSVSSVEGVGLTTGLAKYPSYAQLADGTEVVCVEDHTVASGYNTKALKVRRRSPAGSWGGTTTITTLTSLGDAAPQLVLTESGRLDVYAVDTIGGTREHRIVRYSSHDDGVTWELASVACLVVDSVVVAGPAYAAPARLHVAVGGGQVLLLVAYDPSTSRTVKHYASSDDGATFRLVATYADSWPLALHYDAGIFHALWQTDDSSGARGVYVALGNAFTARDPDVVGIEIFNDTGAEQTPTVYQSGGIWTDPSGILYVAWTFCDNAGQADRTWIAYASADGGTTWSATEGPFGESTATAGGYIAQGLVRGNRSVAALVFVAVDPSGPSFYDAVYLARLGGWTTRTMPARRVVAGSPTEIAGFDRGWCAMEDWSLEDGGTWAESLTGSPTKTAGALSWVLSGTSAMAASYTYDLGTNSTAGMLRVAIDPTSGDGTTYMTVRVASDASPDRSVELRFELYYDLGTYQVVDVHGAATLDSGTIPASAFEVLLGVGRSSWASATGGPPAGSAYRRLLSDDPEDRAWTAMCEAEALTVDTATDPQTSAAIIETNPGASAAWHLTLKWVFVDLASVTGLGLGPAASVDTLHGAPFSPRTVYVRDGLSVRASGACKRLDSWTHTPGYLYGISQALPHVLSDPRRGHKATTADDGFYAFDFGDGETPRGGLWGIYVDGITWDQVAIALRVSGSWSTVATVQLGMPVTFEAEAGTITPDESPGAPHWFAENELAGCWLDEDNGSTITEILGNDEGWWHASAPCRVRLATDPAGTSGTIRFRRGLILLYLPESTTWEGIRVGPEKVFDDVLETAVLAIGRVRVLGDGFDAARSEVRELGSELVELPSGGAVEVRRRLDRRSVELAHTREVATDPGYVRTLRADTGTARTGDPLTLDSLLGAAGRSPVVWIPRLPVFGGSATVIHVVGGHASGALYGRFAPETYRREVVWDRDGVSPVLRGSTVTLVEEVG